MESQEHQFVRAPWPADWHAAPSIPVTFEIVGEKPLGFALKRLVGPFLAFLREFRSTPVVKAPPLRLSDLGAAAVRLPNDTM